MIADEAATLRFIRTALLAILVVGVVGTEVELVLLKHTDGVWQIVPIVLNGVALLSLAWFAFSRSAGSLRAIQATMVVFFVSGGVGFVQHFLGNIAYSRDSNPSLAGMELYKEAVMGSTPTLAPGTMIQLALVGLTFTYRHPILSPRRET